MLAVMCTPTRGFPRWRHVLARDGLIIHTAAQKVVSRGKPVPFELRSLMGEGADVALLRTELVRKALSFDAAWIFFVDDDQTFPPDALFRLIMHDLPMVGCNIRMRREEVLSSCYNLVDGERRRIEPRPEGLEAVEYLGLGVALVKADVFRQLPEPWFLMGPQGEDGHLCEQLRAHGIMPVVDHGLSAEVGHVVEIDARFP